jgi:hypothetical protein
MICLVLTGFLWLNSTLIGAWFNVSAIPQLSPTERLIEIANAFLLTPIAGVLESGAAFFALVQWMLGKRTVSWQPTPKSKGADNVVNSERERLAVSRGKARDRDQSSDVA